jgi:enolase
MNKITKVYAEKIKDSRGNPTLCVTVECGKSSASFSVPSGASTGAHEAFELRDSDGKGVDNAIQNVNTKISQALVGQDIFNQKNIDDILIKIDGTKNKQNMGANAIIGTSIACAKTAADVKNIELYKYLKSLIKIKQSRYSPLLFINLINGGKHAHNNIAFQEYHIVPITNNIKQAVKIGLDIQDKLEDLICREKDIGAIPIGDEGGFAPNLKNIKEPFYFLDKAIKATTHDCDIKIAIDAAASSFYKDGKYEVDGKQIEKEELLKIYQEAIEEYKIFSIEDPFEEEDFESFKRLKNLNTEIKIVGDDLTVTNIDRLTEAVSKGSINAMIIKPNQIGTLTETLHTMQIARLSGIELIISHRSGETDDDFIADLAFAFHCFGIKAGSPRKYERMIKYKRLIQITKS